MGQVGRQFWALVWKNWLCRIRHPVSAACPQASRVVEGGEVGARGWSGSPHTLTELGDTGLLKSRTYPPG